MTVFTTIRDMKHSPFGLEQNAEMDAQRPANESILSVQKNLFQKQLHWMFLCKQMNSKKGSH